MKCGFFAHTVLVSQDVKVLFVTAFVRDGIRERDRKCMFSGRGGLLASSGVWATLEAAHIFPLEHETLWNQFGYSRWITNMDETTGLS